MFNQTMRTAQAGGVRENFYAGSKFESFFLPAFYLNGKHAAKAGHLRGGNPERA